MSVKEYNYGFDNETETVYIKPKKNKVGKYVCNYSDVNIEASMVKQDKEHLMFGVLPYLKKIGVLSSDIDVYVN